MTKSNPTTRQSLVPPRIVDRIIAAALAHYGKKKDRYLQLQVSADNSAVTIWDEKGGKHIKGCGDPFLLKSQEWVTDLKDELRTDKHLAAKEVTQLNVRLKPIPKAEAEKLVEDHLERIDEEMRRVAVALSHPLPEPEGQALLETHAALGVARTYLAKIS